MADRYDIATDSVPEPDPEKNRPVQSGTPIWEMEICLYFLTDESKWTIRKRDKNEEGWTGWSSLMSKNSQGYMNMHRFDTRGEAENWCKQKGLI